MLADRGDLRQLRRPEGSDIIGMVVSRFANRRLDIAVKGLAGDGFGLAPRAGRRATVERTVAHEAELASAAGRALIDHAANRLREGRVANAIEDDLGDGALSGLGLAIGFVIDRLGKAQQRPRPVVVIAGEDEGLGGSSGAR